ncbi:hypothetical protein AS188_03825 [Kocuria flava]|uniref:NAD-dependent epimerase/dehydratase domain-containing protein n=1 Tax=Kocuria flava TaxID=446860 RepID=A0A0U3HCX4_9MICC|nr:NAD-dependent epimerase/dehydratase family protein [Kocuria flava]ALU39017.1 hypothetical protein AS188_03825 [Kocuria flava]GEO91408.1 hypothetical protein KFL01_07140 [Kocuria flava]
MADTDSGERPRVAVLGATGLLGSRVVAHLRARGAEVVEVSRRHEVRDLAEPARAVAAHRGGRRRVLRVPVYLTALGNGDLLPRGEVTTAPTRFEDWLRAGS